MAVDLINLSTEHGTYLIENERPAIMRRATIYSESGHQIGTVFTLTKRGLARRTLAILAELDRLIYGA